MRKLPLTAIALLAGIWLVVGLTIHFVRAAKPTPESVVAYATEHPVEGRTPAQRTEVIEKLARKLNALTYEERREIRMSRKIDSIFRALNQEEQSRFLDLTVPAGFKQMMDAFNKMDPVKRKAIVTRTLADMQRQGDRDAPLPDDPNMQKIVDVGLRSFYADASAETKLDLAPLIEQLQKNLQGLH